CRDGGLQQEGCQSASCRPCPVSVSQSTIRTSVSGYQYGDSFGQGECIFHGDDFRRTFMGRRSVARVGGLPVVTTVSCTTFPFSYAHRCCTLWEMMIVFEGSPAITSS